MTLLDDHPWTAGLALPPAYAGTILAAGEDAFARACERAAVDGPGALFAGERNGMLEFAVVLAPDEPLRSARRAIFAGMLALTEAVGANGPAEMPLSILWPATLLFDGARLGGGQLGWPRRCPEDATPDWLVFGAALIVSKAATGDPGLTPGSTSLDDESFEANARSTLVESFARYLMKTFEIWDQDGFEAVAARYLAFLATDPGAARRIDDRGDCLLGDDRLELLPALAAAAWRDQATGGVRL